MLSLSAPIYCLISLSLLPLGFISGCGNGSADSSGGRPVPTASASPTPAASPTPPAELAPTYTYQVINTYPHDRQAFTQGLLVSNGVLYESTGLNGRSSLRRVELDTGKVLKRVDLSAEHFAEGLAELGGKLYQLTWQSGKGFIYDRETFQKVGEFPIEGEGWGITTDGTDLIISNGSNVLQFMDPQTFKIKRKQQVFGGGMPLDQLNELEYINGEVYANVWKTNSIVRIDPKSGKVVGWIDMSGILPDSQRDSNTDVLNGIAYDKDKDRLFVTGKLWPRLFEIKLVKEEGS
ncbi:MAG: glutaminyl-peptide cyclotransferase [Armatimonadaceae bacterium]